MIVNFVLKRNLVPDNVIRWKIRNLLRQRLRHEDKGSDEANRKQLISLVEELKNSPIAIYTNVANEQHYEIPTEFYQLVLGKHLKYSCAYYNEGSESLNEAEQNMLELTCERAELKDGQEILELGCGWGSLSLRMAEKYPTARITAVTNSRTQKSYIDKEARKRNFSNLEVITADMNSFWHDKQFDRVVSVEMFEHMRNYRELMKRISKWMRNDAKLFIHIFTHKKFAYKFEYKNVSDWMSKYFFTGGIMPSKDLLFYFDEHLVKEKFWELNGIHYKKTAEAWLRNMDLNKREVLKIFTDTYGKKNAMKWFVYWRIFFMACSELWGFNDGKEWIVCHYLFRKK